MYGLRGALIASLILALQAYLVLAGYMCESLLCPGGAYWLTLSVWLGGALGLLSRCRVLERYRTPVVLVAGYGALVFAVALVSDWLVLALLAFAALMLNMVLYSSSREACSVTALLTVLIGYNMLVSLLTGVQPEVAMVPVIALLGAFLLTAAYIDAILAGEAGRRGWLIPMALGFVFLAVAGFAAAYVSMAYRLAAIRGISTACNWSVYCVKAGSKIIPLPSWLYMLALFMQMAYTGAILALPPRLRGGRGGVQRG